MDIPNPGQPESPLLAALTRRGDVLDSTRALQLHALWAPELNALPAGVVQDLVDMRLSKPEFAHFLAKPGQPGQPGQQGQQGQQGPSATVRDYPGARSDLEAQRIHANRDRVAEQLKASAAARAGVAPGLSGTYR